MMLGKFITFEGIDGAGKSSHISAAADSLEAAGNTLLVTREPGGTELAEMIRQAVLHQTMDSVTELLLVFAARRDHLEKRIKPALAQGKWVICDRFTDSTFAYQGGGRQMDLQMIATLESWVQGSLQPDLTLLFDLPPEIAAERRLSARVPDRFEAEAEALFFHRVRDSYLARAAQNPARFVKIDALAALKEVQVLVLKSVASL
jgi:dTMP kinase